MFKSGQKSTPLDYNGGRTEDDLINYLNENCGTFRTPGGGLTASAGRIASLDALATEFVAADVAARQSLADKLEKAAKDLKSSKYASYYGKVCSISSRSLARFWQRVLNM